MDGVLGATQSPLNYSHITGEGFDRFQSEDALSHTAMPTKSVQTLLDDIRLVSEERYALVEAVRALVKKTFTPFAEEVKYGGILFASGVQFCGVFAYKGHVSVEFSQGARIDDVYGHLEGSGKGRRHLKLVSIEDITSKQLAQYLPLALKACQDLP